MAVRFVLIAALATGMHAGTASAQRVRPGAQLLSCDDVRAALARKPDTLAAYERKRLEDFSRQCAQAVDEAFMRRLRFTVAFPVPDTESRAEMWRGVLPPADGSNVTDRKPKDPR